MNRPFEITRKVLRENSGNLIARRNVVAVGAGFKATAGQRTRTECIVCSVDRKQPASALSVRDLVPSVIQNVPTDVIETGRFRALQAPTGRFRPAPCGVSIGHRDITAGTLGCLVRRAGQVFILSNNHVLANSNDAQIGDPILQPGPYDGGVLPGDQLATLEAFVPINFLLPEPPAGCQIASALMMVLNGVGHLLGSKTRFRIVSLQTGTNLVDAAIAKPVRPTDVVDEILGIGPISGTVQGELGMRIKKAGRTTGITNGEITQVDVTVNVGYGGTRIAQFTDQLMAGAMSQGGDSGSAVLDEQNRLVGLLFAGSDNSTILNRIEHVLTALDVTR